MPELPEVESVKNALQSLVQGATITGVDIFYRRMIHSDYNSFITGLQGKTIQSLARRGKHILFFLSGGAVLISHLRMEGKYYALKPNEPLTRFARAIFYLADGRRLVYDDMRKFGTLTLKTQENYLSGEPLEKVGIEPSELSQHPELVAIIRRKRKPVKDLLLDQTVIAGVGNIYADEILFRCRLHPETLASDLSDEEIARLLKHTEAVIAQAVAMHGSSIRSYHSPEGIDGLFQQELLAYGRVGEPCPRCHTPLFKMQHRGRGTTFCPKCQKVKRPYRIIAITGEIASGKSVGLALAKTLGYRTLSSDVVVHELYQKASVRRGLKKLFGPAIFNDQTLDRGKLLTLLLQDAHALAKLEAFIHPLVEQVILRTIRTSPAPVWVIEVPLLFKANFHRWVDVIIGVTVDPKRQKSWVTARNPNNAGALLALNEHNDYAKHRKQLDIEIKNDGTLPSLQAQFKRAFAKALAKVHS